MKHIYLFIIIIFGCSHTSWGQQLAGSLIFKEVEIRRAEESLLVNMTVDLERVELYKQDVMFLSPMLLGNDGQNEVQFDVLAVTGKVRDKVMARSIKLDRYGYDAFPSRIMRRHNGQPQSFDVAYVIPFDQWMADSRMVITQIVTGCRNCPPCFAEYTFTLDVEAPEPFVPQYRVAYVTPEAEQVKRRSESYAARLNYIVNKHDLLRNFGNNSAVLDEVDRIFREITNDEALTIEELKVTGYASPEGNYNSNIILSRDRAYAFVNYLSGNHAIPQSIIEVDWKGEDWEGLREVVDKSLLEDRTAILNILDRNPDVATRKRQLMSYKGGSVYRNLLQNYYPPLRRNEYTITFVARAFDVREAKDLIRSKPHYLSLNEMFLVANSYPRDSKEFKEVFDIAVRLYPEDSTARTNSAALEIESGLYEQALRRLQYVESPQAWNNSGVAHAMKGDKEQAERFFKMASDAGLADAGHNLMQLKQVSEEQ